MDSYEYSELLKKLQKKIENIKNIIKPENLEKRLLKAQKRKYNEIVSRIKLLQNELFPNGSLQERQANFSEFYEELGDDLIKNIFKALQPLRLEFDIIEN